MNPSPVGTSSFSQTFSAAAAVKAPQDSSSSASSHAGRGNEKKSDAAKASPSQPDASAPVLNPAQPVAPPPVAAQPVAAAQPFGTQALTGDSQPDAQTIQPAIGNADGVVGQDAIAMGGTETMSPANAPASTDAAVNGEDSASDASKAGVVAEDMSKAGAVAEDTSKAGAVAEDTSKDGAIVEAGQGSDPSVVPQQLVPFVSQQQAPIADLHGLDLSAVAADAKLPGDISSAKDGISKPANAPAKDSKAGSSDVRSKQKSDDSSAQNATTTSSNPASFKVAEAMAHSDHGGSAAQPGANDAVVQQAAQAAVSAATEGKQMPVHEGDSGAAAPQIAAQAPSNIDTTNAAADAQNMSAVNNARLIQSMHQSEMRLGMYSAEFGSISINTSLTHQSIAAQISMDHSALGNALAAHMPAIEEKLSNAYGVQARVEVRDGSASSGNSSAHSGERQQGRPDNFATSSSASLHAMPAITHATSTLAADTSRLDIRI